MDDRPAVLLVNHGSRQPHAAAYVHRLATVLRRDEPGRIVAVSFLELNQPSPADALRRLSMSGVSEVNVVPLLFSAGYHYRMDLPAAVDAAVQMHPGLRVHIAPPLLAGGEAELIDGLDARLGEASHRVSNGTTVRPDGLVLLAAGSSDTGARARVVQLADAWGSAHGLPAEVAFCDLRGHDVRAAIALLQARGARQIACGSLFLAAGRLLAAAEQTALHAGADVVAGPLGTTPALLDLVRRRCLEPIAAG